MLFISTRMYLLFLVYSPTVIKALVCRYWFELVEELATTRNSSSPFILLVMSVKMCSRRQDWQKASRHWKCLIVVLSHYQSWLSLRKQGCGKEVVM